jgi:hypothetical protein
VNAQGRPTLSKDETTKKGGQAVTTTERRRRRQRIADALAADRFATQAAAVRAGDLMPRVETTTERDTVEAIHRRHGVEISHTW